MRDQEGEEYGSTVEGLELRNGLDRAYYIGTWRDAEAGTTLSRFERLAYEAGERYRDRVA